MRKYKKNRRKARSSYRTYSQYYDKIAKKNPDMMEKKLTRKEFKDMYDKAKDAGMKNPAITIARLQRKWEYQFSRRWKSLTGETLTGRETTEERRMVFLRFAEEYYDGSLASAREEFESLY